MRTPPEHLFSYYASRLKSRFKPQYWEVNPNNPCDVSTEWFNVMEAKPGVILIELPFASNDMGGFGVVAFVLVPHPVDAAELGEYCGEGTWLSPSLSACFDLMREQGFKHVRVPDEEMQPEPA